MRRQPILLSGLTALFLFFSSTLHAQSSYDDYPPSSKTFEYREDFSSSSAFWESYEANRRSVEIEDGGLIFKSLNDKTQVKYQVIELDWSGDWELEIGVIWLGGKETSAMDFIWDKESGNSNKYHFGFTAGGKYVLAEYKNDDYDHILKFVPASFVYKSSRNRMTVRKVDQTYYFFVNEQLVKSMPYKPIKGDMIGFTVPPNTSIKVDYLYALSLNSKSGANTSSSTSSRNLPPGKNYVGVMTKYNGYSVQRWRTRDNFPKDEIKAEWENDYYVSDLSYDNDKWSLIMSKGTGFTDQTWITRKEWPKDLIKEKWDLGYYISELDYGNGVWAIVFSKGTDYTRQRWATKGSTFPSDKIKEFGDDGLSITEIVYGNDRWALVASKDSDIREQKWFKKNAFPESEINTYLGQGYSVTQLSYEKELWVLVMTKYASRKPQQWFVSETFPKDKIREYWDQDYYLTDITYGNTGSGTLPQSEPTVPSREFSNLNELLTGKWFGGGKDDTDREKGYMIFEADRGATMIANGEIIGGKAYEVEGTKIDLSYEVDETASPRNFDLVFKMGGTEFGRMKGIIKFIDEDTFQLQIASDMQEPRPTKFSSNPNDVATFERVK